MLALGHPILEQQIKPSCLHAHKFLSEVLGGKNILHDQDPRVMCMANAAVFDCSGSLNWRM